jgi:uroporphyrinogen-III synthase
MRRLIILRPEPGASASLERARALGIEAEAIPLFEIRPVAWTAPDPAGFDALLMTSANAARHGGSELARLVDLPVHAVGAATAAAARAAGFTVVGTGEGGVAELIAILPPGLRLLQLAGRHRRDVPGALAIAVYESVELPPTTAIRSVAGAVVAIHSPRAGRRLAELAKTGQTP